MNQNLLERFSERYEDLKNSVFIFGAIGWVIFLIVPMPAIVIDFSISFTIAISMVTLIQASTIDTWEKFRTFPLILLMATIFRIALSIATTRKIISGQSPGNVIEAAGEIIIRDQIAIGFVIFVILIVVQFIIAFGANRFGEVTARFTLDSLPGKQMSIDNDLNQGVIDAETASLRKERLQQEVDYYGSLDGAGKYIRGDVWASVTMIVVNLVVGLIVGVVEMDLTFEESLNRFTKLSVGDGVVMLVSALMVTVSGAVVMGRVEDTKQERAKRKNQNFLLNIYYELFPNSKNLYVIGVVMFSLGLIGLPMIPFFSVGVFLIVSGLFASIRTKKEKEEEKQERLRVEEQQKKELEKEDIKHEVEPITIEVGYKLVPVFMDQGKNIFGDKRETIQDKIEIMRGIFGNKLGVSIPLLKMRDDITINPPTKYNIYIKETKVAEGEIEEGKVLAIPSLFSTKEIEGKPTKDPVHNQDALWIDEVNVNEAIEAEYDIWDPLNIVATHLHTVLEKNIWRFITLQEVSDMVEEVSVKHPILKEKLDELNKLPLLRDVLISLIKEEISIKDLPTIIEAFLDAVSATEELDTIVSLVRQSISRQIVTNYLNQGGNLYLAGFENESEYEVVNQGGRYILNISGEQLEDIIDRIRKEKEVARTINYDLVLFANSAEFRTALSSLLQARNEATPVISSFELPTDIDQVFRLI